MTKVRLRATQGADEANFEGSRYRVDNDGNVWVDEGAVAPLLATGGFVLADPPPPVASSGMVKVRNDADPEATCTVEGVNYVPDQDGIVTVPAGAVADVAAHGFRPVPPERPRLI